MKNESVGPLVLSTPSEDDIRDYAYHLYQQSNCAPGQDLDNWLEATACLKANIPAHHCRTRLHRHVNGPESSEPSLLSTEARILAS
jgi:hypothetical protein